MKKVTKIIALMLVVLLGLIEVSYGITYTDEQLALIDDYASRVEDWDDSVTNQEIADHVLLPLIKEWIDQNDVVIKQNTNPQGEQQEGGTLYIGDATNEANYISVWGENDGIIERIAQEIYEQTGDRSKFNSIVEYFDTTQTREQLSKDVQLYVAENKGVIGQDGQVIPDGDIQFDENENDNNNPEQDNNSGEYEEPEGESTPSIMDMIGGAIDALAGIVLYPIRLIIVGLGGIFNSVLTGIASLGGDVGGQINIEDIIYTTGNSENSVELVSLNFFNFSEEGTTSEIVQIRKGIATWFYLLRNLAIIIALCTLIYTGIRMAISSIAEDRAKYKNMFLNWVVQMILIFFMQYIIFATIGINNAIVGALSPTLGEEGNEQVANYTEQMRDMALTPLSNFTTSFGAAALYCILLGATFSFLILYIKRMMTVAFLILISPLVTVTYAIDKMGDSKSQAMNTWLKEFVYNILIQPFHCILYAAFAGTSLDLLVKNGADFGNAVVAIVCLMFMFKAEDILKKIFAFSTNAKSLGSGIATATALGAGLGTLSSMFKKDSGENQGENNQPMPDIEAMYQNQNAATQAAKNAEQTEEAVRQVATGGIARTVEEIEAARRRNRRKEAWEESGGAVGLAGRTLVGQAKVALPVMTAFLGAGQGNLGAMVAAGGAGVAIGQGIENKITQRGKQSIKESSRQARANERVFEKIQQEQERKWREKGGKWENYSQEEIANDQRKLLNIQDLDSIVDEDEKKYATVLQALRDTYKALGYNNPEGNVIEFTRRIPRE